MKPEPHIYKPSHDPGRPHMGTPDWWRRNMPHEPDWWQRVFAEPFNQKPEPTETVEQK